MTRRLDKITNYAVNALSMLGILWVGEKWSWIYEAFINAFAN